MGSGKSYWAKRLSEQLHLPCWDSDAQIEAREGRSVAEIFQKEGEARFRQLEKKWVDELPQKPLAVIATGGGLPCFSDNIKTLREKGWVVFLNPPQEKIFEQLQRGIGHRPLLDASNWQEAWMGTFKSRLAIYQEAHFEIRYPESEESWEVVLKNF